jgi:hypothetical protein
MWYCLPNSLLCGLFCPHLLGGLFCLPAFWPSSGFLAFFWLSGLLLAPAGLLAFLHSAFGWRMVLFLFLVSSLGVSLDQGVLLLVWVLLLEELLSSSWLFHGGATEWGASALDTPIFPFHDSVLDTPIFRFFDSFLR